MRKNGINMILNKIIPIVLLIYRAIINTNGG